jgi:hypothetical protein
MGCIQSKNDHYRNWMTTKWNHPFNFLNMKHKKWKVFKSRNINILDKNILIKSIEYYNMYYIIHPTGIYFFRVENYCTTEWIVLYWYNIYEVLFSEKSPIIYLNTTYLEFNRDNNKNDKIITPNRFIQIFVNRKDFSYITKIMIDSYNNAIKKIKEIENIQANRNTPQSILIPGQNRNININQMSKAVISSKSKINRNRSTSRVSNSSAHSIQSNNVHNISKNRLSSKITPNNRSNTPTPENKVILNVPNVIHLNSDNIDISNNTKPSFYIDNFTDDNISDTNQHIEKNSDNDSYNDSVNAVVSSERTLSMPIQYTSRHDSI